MRGQGRKAVSLYKGTFIDIFIHWMHSNCFLTDPHISNLALSATQFCKFIILQVKRYFLTSTLHYFSFMSTYAH